jgi:hypothetical protein
MGLGVRRAVRRSELSQMEATPPTITAGLADATRLPSTLPRYGTDGSADLINVGGQQHGQTERTHCPSGHEDS